jgi:hypothetical protein
MPRVVGIDFKSDAVDLVTLDIDADEPRWLHIPCGANSNQDNDSFETARAMRELLPIGHWWDDVVLIAVEKPFSQSRRSISALMRVQGAVLASVPFRITAWEIPPGEWRKEIGLKGNAPKEEVALWALDHGADMDWSQDACDALAIATAALRINTRGLEEAA